MGNFGIWNAKTNKFKEKIGQRGKHNLKVKVVCWKQGQRCNGIIKKVAFLF